MVEMESLIDLRELKWEYLTSMLQLRGAFADIYYDDLANILRISFVPRDMETVVFYVGKTGVLVEPATLNVVGLHLENIDEDGREAIAKYFV